MKKFLVMFVLMFALAGSVSKVCGADEFLTSEAEAATVVQTAKVDAKASPAPAPSTTPAPKPTHKAKHKAKAVDHEHAKPEAKKVTLN